VTSVVDFCTWFVHIIRPVVGWRLLAKYQMGFGYISWTYCNVIASRSVLHGVNPNQPHIGGRYLLGHIWWCRFIRTTWFGLTDILSHPISPKLHRPLFTYKNVSFVTTLQLLAVETNIFVHCIFCNVMLSCELVWQELSTWSIQPLMVTTGVMLCGHLCQCGKYS